MLINQPPNNSVDNGGQVSQGWSEFFNNIFVLLSALTQSGTTLQRPIKLLWVGRTFFDTTLGLPIWYNGADWILADGTVV